MSIEVSGDGPTVVLVHGLGFSRDRWSAQVDALVAAGFRAVRYDLRGFGDTPVPEPYGMDDLVADLEGVRLEVGAARMHLVGHSLGGMLSQAYALRHPERVESLALLSSTSHSGTRGSAYAAALSTLSLRGYDNAMADEAFRARIEGAVLALTDPEVRQELDGTLSPDLPSGEHLLRWIRKLTLRPNPAQAHAWQVSVGFSTRERLGQIECPALVMHGTRDAMIPFAAGELLHRGLTGSRWVRFDGVGHALPMDAPDRVNESLLGFLARDSLNRSSRTTYGAG